MSCPICAGSISDKYKPFCSKRCAEEDLAKWLKGSYRIPINDLEDVEEKDNELEEARTLMN